MRSGHVYNGAYCGENLTRIAFPMGGIGAGMVCLEGTGALSHLSIRNQPEVFKEPRVFSALSIKRERKARVLEGPVPKWKVFGNPSTSNGALTTYGLPRFREAVFSARFPSAQSSLPTRNSPSLLRSGWAFIPIPTIPTCRCYFEYRFSNNDSHSIGAVFSFVLTSWPWVTAKTVLPTSTVSSCGSLRPLTNPSQEPSLLSSKHPMPGKLCLVPGRLV